MRTGVPPDIFVKKKKTDIFRRFSRKLRIEKALQLDFERVVFKESSKQGASKLSSVMKMNLAIFMDLKKAPNKEHRNYETQDGIEKVMIEFKESSKQGASKLYYRKTPKKAI